MCVQIPVVDRLRRVPLFVPYRKYTERQFYFLLPPLFAPAAKKWTESFSSRSATREPLEVVDSRRRTDAPEPTANPLPSLPFSAKTLFDGTSDTAIVLHLGSVGCGGGSGWRAQAYILIVVLSR